MDPNNARLRIELGGIYYQLESYNQALAQFQTAIILKNNYANAYYNLAAGLKKTNQPEEAALAMEKVIELLPESSQSYEQAVEELKEIQILIPEKEESSPSATIEKQP